MYKRMKWGMVVGFTAMISGLLFVTLSSGVSSAAESRAAMATTASEAGRAPLKVSLPPTQIVGITPAMFKEGRDLMNEMYRQAFVGAAMAQTAEEKAQAQELLGRIIVTAALLDHQEAEITKAMEAEVVPVPRTISRGGMAFAGPAIAFLVLSLLAVVGVSLSDSAFTTLKKRFFCPWEIKDVEVEFIPGFTGLAGKRSGDVYSCTAFADKYHVTCGADCADDELIAMIPAVFEGPAIQYTNP